ncbi:MAG: amidohydrolase [Candidatus Palauibacterales bacterium]|nr:amidohydrolase [Candidatus Palauibacterales bacterium]
MTSLRPLSSAAGAAVAAALVLVAAAPAPAQDADARQAAIDEVEALGGTVHDMSMTLWEYAETALEEQQSSDHLVRHLEEAGFEVEEGVAGMPTAFVAEWTRGSGGPKVGILAEYDALPGVGNAPVPERQPREDGVASGHGCGHNLFGAGSVTAGIALKRTMEEQGIDGTVRVYGTPAEETLIGKVYMAREGLFDDLDAALVWHPSTDTGVSNSTSLAMNNFRVSFSGQAAHGASDPWNGRSALDAVELTTHGINLMREHVRPTARIHYVVENGGDVPNVVPEQAGIWGFVRDTARSSVDAHYEWIENIARGAARGTRTEAEVTMVTGVHATLLNRPLQEAVQANLERVGTPDYPQSFHRFAEEMQAGLEIEQEGLDTEIEPLEDEPGAGGGGSTDVAEVSRITPTVSFSVTSAPAGVPWHSWATSAAHGRDGAVLAAETAAKVMAATGADLLTSPELREEARSFFEEAMGDEEYESPLPPGQEPPVGGGE